MTLAMIKTSENISFLTIDRPEARNALNLESVKKLCLEFKKADKDTSTKIILLSGAGEQAFCSGADLKELLANTPAKRKDFFLSLKKLFIAMLQSRKPIVAKVHGYALAGGMGLIGASDIVLASDTSVYGLPEIRVGLGALTIMPVLALALNEKTLAYLTFSGHRFNAESALRLGLISHVYQKEHLNEEVLSFVRTLANRNAEAIIAAKKGIHELYRKKTIQQLNKTTALAIGLIQKKSTLKHIEAMLTAKESRS